MKVIMSLLILIFLQSAKAEQICESYITNEWSNSRYIVETIFGENIVTDNKTGLIWKQCSEGLTGSDCSNGNLAAYTWQQALNLASITDFANYVDWRVPSISELRSISAINCFNPTINENVFPNTPSVVFWSSSPMFINQANVWGVHFKFGSTGIGNRLENINLRLVRSGR